MKELVICKSGDGGLLLYDGDQLISRGRSEASTLRWFPRRVVRWSHRWIVSGEEMCFEVHFESSWTLSFRLFEFRIISSQIVSGFGAELDLLDIRSFGEQLAANGLTFGQEGAREQFVDQRGEVLLQRVPVWKDDELARGISDKYLVSPNLDLRLVPGMIEICRFFSMEFWQGYRRP